MALPTNHQWPNSLRSAAASEALAVYLHDARREFHVQPAMPWADVPAPHKTIYRDLALRVLLKLGAPVGKGEPDLRLESFDRNVVRMFTVVK